MNSSTLQPLKPRQVVDTQKSETRLHLMRLGAIRGQAFFWSLIHSGGTPLDVENLKQWANIKAKQIWLEFNWSAPDGSGVLHWLMDGFIMGHDLAHEEYLQEQAARQHENALLRSVQADGLHQSGTLRFRERAGVGERTY